MGDPDYGLNCVLTNNAPASKIATTNKSISIISFKFQPGERLRAIMALLLQLGVYGGNLFFLWSDPAKILFLVT